jgi:hypothetical protein
VKAEDGQDEPGRSPGWLPMTEADWWGTTDPGALIDWLFFEALASDRKLRLFSVACCQRVVQLAPISAITQLLPLVEQFADGWLPESELQAAVRQSWAANPFRSPLLIDPHSDAALAAESAILFTADAGWEWDRPAERRLERGRNRGSYEAADHRPAVQSVASLVTTVAAASPADSSGQFRKAEHTRQVHLIHDIFGPLPFREVAVDPRWLTPDVVTIAKGIYDEKAFDRLPILADALQDAGCDNDEMLKHCRAENWEHVRGCWVVDLLLGRDWREPAS